MKKSGEPNLRDLRKALKRAPRRARFAWRTAYRTWVLLARLENLAIKSIRAIKAVAYKRQRKLKRWTDAHPYTLLGAFPLWGNPHSFPPEPDARTFSILRASWPLMAVAVTPWVFAFGQVMSMFIDMIEAKAVAQIGRVGFEELEAWLELSSVLFSAPVYIGIILVAGAKALMHRAELVVTQWDWRALPRVGYRFHLVQVSSMALYLGLLVQGVAWSMNHQSFAEPLLRAAVNSPLILIPGFLWLIVHPYIQKNQKAVSRKLYGSSVRAILAAILTITILIGVLAAMMLTLRQPEA